MNLKYKNQDAFQLLKVYFDVLSIKSVNIKLLIMNEIKKYLAMNKNNIHFLMKSKQFNCLLIK